jgi:hypothetical protein
MQGFRAAEEGLPKSHCTLKVGTSERTAWFGGWHCFHALEAAKEKADGRDEGIRDRRDPKASMRRYTAAMFANTKGRS